MRASDWAHQQPTHLRPAHRWFEAGTLPVPARRLPSGTILVEETRPHAGQVALYARDSSYAQRPDR